MLSLQLSSPAKVLRCKLPENFCGWNKKCIQPMDNPSKSLLYLRPRYLLSLPERLLRALAAGLGGLIFEFTELALPTWLRRSRLYQALIYRFLRLSVEWVGDVQGVLPPDTVEIGDLATRKAVGNVIELVSFVAVGWSPLWLLAAASDLTGGTRAYLNAFVSELRKEGVLQDGDDIRSVDDLLNVLEASTGIAADMVDVPPLRAKELRTSWQALKGNVVNLPDAGQLTRLYKHLQQVARQEDRSLGDLSSLIAAGALKAGLEMGSTHVFAYYHHALDALKAEGWGAYARRIARPYFHVGRSHFDPSRVTFTDKVLARLRQ
jgi:hypothetical protein